MASIAQQRKSSRWKEIFALAWFPATTVGGLIEVAATASSSKKLQASGTMAAYGFSYDAGGKTIINRFLTQAPTGTLRDCFRADQFAVQHSSAVTIIRSPTI